jgi:hypothetical protein
MNNFFSITPLSWLLFIIPLLFFIVVVIMLRIYIRFYKEARRSPDKVLNSMLSFAEKVGIDTSDVIKFRDSIVGEKLEDFGILERRKYRAMIIEYRGSLCQVEGEKQVVLQITEKIDESRKIDLITSDIFDVIYCPLKYSVCKALSSILGANEGEFLSKAAGAETLAKVSATLRKNYWDRIKDISIGWLGFQILKSFGIIDEASKIIPLKSGKQAIWAQKIGAYIGKEKNELLLILGFRSKLTVKGRKIKFLKSNVFNYTLYYPFGASGRESLRKALQIYFMKE